MSVWDAMVGQDNAVGLLRQAVSNPSAMTHAWLITGPPGSGRSVAARAFAAALQCPQGGCGECHECATVLAGTHPDVTTVATEAVTIGIDTVRDLVGAAARRPQAGRWRIVIVEDADRMTERTSNVLLKSIEEPPDHTVWLLAAPSPRDVIVTIRSRCRPVGLRIPPVDAVARLLVERDGIAPEKARAAAMAAQCHIGMARRLATDPEARARRAKVLEIPSQAASVGTAVIAAGELVDLAKKEAEQRSKDREVADAASVRRAYGLGEGEEPPAKLRAYLNQHKTDDGEARRRTTRWQRDVLDRAMVDLLSFYRDVLSVQARSGVELVNATHTELVMDVAETSTIATTLRRVAVITQARERLAANVAPAIAVEAMTVGIALAGGPPA
jgi:DNA polymerase-3 subunit delta'